MSSITDFIGGEYKKMLGRSMSQEEADELFYKTHSCFFDDFDKEQARIDRWIEDNNIEITD